MKDFKILVDSNCDLSREFIEKNNVPFASLTCTFKGSEYKVDFGKSLDFKTFYEEVRHGEMPTTAQVNVFAFENIFRELVSQGLGIIYIAFSSALSGTYSSSVIARQNILEEFKDADISIIDTKAASLGQGLLSYYAYEMKDNGASKDEIVEWLENNKMRMNHWFTVDDLNHLKRGGRVSAASAAIGTILDIKPILNVNDEGKLMPVTKVKGRKKSIRTLAEKLKERIVNPENQVIGISHGDCVEEAEQLKRIITEEVKVRDVLITTIGPSVGAHSGPGTLALFFFGENRNI